MDEQIVLHKGFWWTKDDGGGVTETEASPASCCYDLTTNQPNEPANISRWVPNKRIMIQAGGNVGFFTKQYADIFEKVYTFEPVPLLFHCLNKNIQKDNVFKFQACLGDTHGCVSMGRRAGNNAGSENVVGPGSTPTMLIDDLKLPGCDLIQLDLEGYEFHALRGATETIRKYRPILALELAGWEARYGVNGYDIEAWLKKYGYYCVAVIDANRIYAVTGVPPEHDSKNHSAFSALKIPS